MSSAAPGAVLFARYAYPPNALGYCGPGDPAALLGAASGRYDLRALEALAPRFEGAWPYLQLIAACNGIENPLDWRVVKAYWLGNGLLSSVPPTVFAASLDERFSPRAGRTMSPIVDAVGAGGVPHHSFHVFGVYPWLGLLRAGRGAPALEVLDRCRIRWGRIECLLGGRALVRCRHLAFDGSALALGEERLEQVEVALEGTGLVEGVRPGDVVSLHWDWVCDRLSPNEVARLEHYTRLNLASVNSLSAPGPALAAERDGT